MQGSEERGREWRGRASDSDVSLGEGYSSSLVMRICDPWTSPAVIVPIRSKVEFDPSPSMLPTARAEKVAVSPGQAYW